MSNSVLVIVVPVPQICGKFQVLLVKITKKEAVQKPTLLHKEIPDCWTLGLYHFLC